MRRRATTGVGPLAIALKVYKQDQGLTDEQLAQRLGTSRAWVTTMINDAEPGIPTLNRVAKFFNWTLAEYGQILVYEGYRGRKPL